MRDGWRRVALSGVPEAQAALREDEAALAERLKAARNA